MARRPPRKAPYAGPNAVSAHGNVTLLEECRAADALVALDYDSLQALTPCESAATRLAKPTVDRLKRLGASRSVVMITGRDRADIFRLLDGVRLFDVIGNHGAETASSKAVYDALLESWSEDLHERLEHLRDIRIERRSASISIHHGPRPQAGLAVATIRRVAKSLDLARIHLGEVDVQVIPQDAPNEIEALQSIRDRLQHPPTVHIGNDAVDANIARSLADAGILHIAISGRIGRRTRSFADDASQVNRLLDKLT